MTTATATATKMTMTDTARDDAFSVAIRSVRFAARSVVIALCWGLHALGSAPSLRRSQRGEGVISAAIAVLIIASLGALMWVGFKALWQSAEQTTNSEIAKIGQ